MQNTNLQLVKLVLNHGLWEQYKNLLSPDFFPEPYNLIWKSIGPAHDQYKRDLTEQELYNLIVSSNGTLTSARKDSISDILTQVKDIAPIGNDIAQEVIRYQWRQEIGRQFIEKSYSFFETAEPPLADLQKILDQAKDNYIPISTEVEHITTDVNELLSLFDQKTLWRFNLANLAEHIPGIAPGDFAIFAARPEMGKTCFWISLACAPGGWCWQGAKVHALNNEEFAKRNMIRAVSSATGRILQEIKDDPNGTNELFKEIRDNIKLVDCNDWGLEEINTYCDTYHPDILIIDQLDKIKYSGYKDAPSHEKLQGIYEGARDVGKRHNCAVIGLSQISAEGEGKDLVDYSMLAGSKTAKAGEADLILCIGNNATIQRLGGDEEINRRMITAAKNKLSGWRGQSVSYIDPLRSRYKQ